MARQAFSAVIDYYAILEVQSTATTDQIRTAYKRLSLKNHPDKTGGDQHATKCFIAVKNAHDILTDQNIRGQYDQARQQRARGTTSSRTARPTTSDTSTTRATSPNPYAEAYERDRAREEQHKRTRAREEERRHDEAREGERKRDEAQETERKRKRDFEQAKYEREQDEARRWADAKRAQAECRMREDLRNAEEKARGAQRDREREQAFQAAEAATESVMLQRNTAKRQRERDEMNSKLWADSSNRASREQPGHAYSDFFKAGRAQCGPTLNEQYNMYGQMRGHSTFCQQDSRASYEQAPPNTRSTHKQERYCAASCCSGQGEQGDEMPEFELTGRAIERKIINVMGVHMWEACTGTQKAPFDQGDFAREMAIKRGVLSNDGSITRTEPRGPKKTTDARKTKRPTPAQETSKNRHPAADSPPTRPSPFSYVFGSGGSGGMQGSAMFGKNRFSNLKVHGKGNKTEPKSTPGGVGSTR